MKNTDTEPIDLAQLEALCDAATPGPWYHETPLSGMGGGAGVNMGEQGNKDSPYALFYAHTGSQEKANAAFSAAFNPKTCAALLLRVREAEAGKWIACAERLPAESGFYLVFGNCTGEDEAAPHCDIAGFHAEVPMFAKYRQPTHWQPLPTPPQA